MESITINNGTDIVPGLVGRVETNYGRIVAVCCDPSLRPSVEFADGSVYYPTYRAYGTEYASYWENID